MSTLSDYSNASKQEFLSLGGGALTGNIETLGIITKSVDNGALGLVGATSISNGASLYLYGKTHSSNVGWFTLNACDGTNNKYLIGKPDGTLLWGGNKVHVVTATYNDGTTWYRKYNDGWVEQSGRTSTTTPNTGMSITLPVAMKDTNYTVLCTNRDSTNRRSAQGWVSSTTVIVVRSISGTDVSTTALQWYVCGYSA